MTASIKRLRRTRRVQIASAVVSTLCLALNLSVGHYLLAVVNVIAVVALSFAAFAQTRTIRIRERLDRPRPDYSLIARLEREVYGKTFEHEGSAPAVFLPTRPEDVAQQAEEVRRGLDGLGLFGTVHAMRRERKEREREIDAMFRRLVTLGGSCEGCGYWQQYGHKLCRACYRQRRTS